MTRLYIWGARLCLMATVCPPAFAVPPSDGFAEDAQILGVGAGLSCGQWLSSRKGGRSADAEQWVLGFVSGAAVFFANKLMDSDPDAVTAWIDQYCGSYPLSSLHAASSKVVEALMSVER